MFSLDESSIRRAASWQDFKEGQSFYQLGVVTEYEKTETGWKGHVKVGSRIYRPNVVARTPTWFDAKCSCPANLREGSFCSHAIAVALQLISPKIFAPVEKSQPTAAPVTLFSVSWKIHLMGSWQKSLEKGHAAFTLETVQGEPSVADHHLSTWLLAHKAKTSQKIQLALQHENLASFLDTILGHPAVFSGEQLLVIDSGLLTPIKSCRLEEGQIHLKAPSQNLLRISETYWKITPEGLSKVGSGLIPSELTPLFRSLVLDSSAILTLDFFLNQLDTLQAFLDFSACPWFEKLQFLPVSPEIILRISGDSQKLKIQLSASYGSEILPRLESQKVLTKHPQAEIDAQQILASRLGLEIASEFTLTDSQEIQNFLTQQLKTLPADWQKDIEPKAQALLSSFVFVSPQIITFEQEDGTIRFQLSFETDSAEMLSTAEIRRLLRFKNSPNRHHSGKKIILSTEIEQLIDPMLEELDLYQENGFYTAKKASAEIIREMSKSLSNPLIANDLESNTEIQSVPLPESLCADLRPYQKHGFSWMIDRVQRYGGALLADDMGLGKTLQTISSLEYLFTTYSQSFPALVIVTTSLLGNWKSEFKRFAPARKTIVLHGSNREVLKEEIQPGDVVLTTYATLARDLAWHLKQEYLVAVIDEASLIRNPDTDHSKAVAKLKTRHRIALTGTPIENSARDLWSIFRFIQPGWLGSRKEFKERYEQALQAPETSFQTGQLLRLKTSPFILRRTKQQVAPELSSKIHIDEYCTLSADQSHLYKEIQREGEQRFLEMQDPQNSAAARFQIFSTLLRLRQTCCDLALFDSEKLKSLSLPRRSAKLERLLEITTQAISSGSRLLVFSQFRSQLLEIEKQLEIHQISSLRLDGKTRNRSELVERFQSPQGPSVFLISLKAGGYGLNLTAADIVVHFDPWWNPAAEAQATDRAHRIGQTKPVTVFRLLTRGTVEEKVIELQSSKKTLAASLDESLTPSDSSAFSMDELAKLLRN